MTLRKLTFIIIQYEVKFRKFQSQKKKKKKKREKVQKILQLLGKSKIGKEKTMINFYIGRDQKSFILAFKLEQFINLSCTIESVPL